MITWLIPPTQINLSPVLSAAAAAAAGVAVAAAAAPVAAVAGAQPTRGGREDVEVHLGAAHFARVAGKERI